MRSVTKMKSVISPCLSYPAAPFAIRFQSLRKSSIFSRFKVLASIASVKNPINVVNLAVISSSLKPLQNPSQARSFSSDATCSPSSSGEIHVIVGPMFAGKTTTLLRRMKSESSNGSFQGGNTKDDTLKGLCISGNVAEAVKTLCRGGVQVECETYSLLLQDCIFRKYYRLGKRIHWQMVVVGFVPNEYLNVKLLILYAKAGDLSIARFLFQKLKVKSLVSWNSMIAGYVQKGMDEVGLSVYSEMRRDGLRPDQYTFASVFRACASLAILEQGKQAHAMWIKIQKNGNLVVNSAIMDMYFKCSSLSDGHLVFEKSLDRNVVMWTSLISGYGHHGRVADVLSSFRRMLIEGFRPNHVTLLVVLVACSHGGMVSEAWECFDSMMRDYGLQPQGKHYAAMVDVLGRAGKLDDAYNFILSSPCKEHPVLWGALVGACRIHGNMDLAKVAAKNYFDLEPGNSGKYVVLGNAYASFGLWDNVAKIRSSMSEAGMRKDPSYSMIEVQREAHFFYMEHNVHDKTEEIYEMVERMIYALKDVELLEHIPDVEC